MKQKDILIILILLFVCVVAWIGSSVYHSLFNSTISETTAQNISPIKPDFDTKIIEELKQRRSINPSFELGNVTPTPISFPTPIFSQQNSSNAGKLTL